MVLITSMDTLFRQIIGIEMAGWFGSKHKQVVSSLFLSVREIVRHEELTVYFVHSDFQKNGEWGEVERVTTCGWLGLKTRKVQLVL